MNIPLNSKSSQKIIDKLKDNLDKGKTQDDKLKNINFEQLINEFSRLFGIEDKRNNENNIYEEKKRNKSAKFSKLLFNKSNNNINMLINYINSDEKSSYTESVKKEIRINSLKEINKNNFEKYHDLKLTLNATKAQIKKMKNNNNLAEDDINLYNIIDIRDINNQEHNCTKSPKTKSQLKINNLIENYLDNYKKDYNKTLRVEKSFKKRKKLFINKKPLYNFYWGKPQIINIDNDLYNTNKIISKYDYVPNEFLTNIKNI